MSIESRHPDYDKAKRQWDDMRAAIAGDDEVKEQGETYLPKPGGFYFFDDQGVKAYAAYKTRAQFPTIVGPTIRGMNGVVHRIEAQIELPTQLDGLFEKATPDGLPLEALHRRITRELLSTGRFGLLADIESNASAKSLPFIATYCAESIINWSDKRDMFVLDESGKVRAGADSFEWVDRNKYRALLLKDGKYVVQVYEADSNGKADETAAKNAEPSAIGGKPLEEIPFVVIGSTDLKVEIDEIPLQGVAKAAFAMYRLDADYRHQLYMSGQETLVLTGVDKDDKPAVVGAGVVLTLKEGADAKYVSPSCEGIASHRTAIQDEKENAVLAGARLFEQVQKAAESGDALRIRFAAQTATLTSIAQAAASGLEKALKYCAQIIGANPDEVVVTPNLSFIDSTLTAQEGLALVNMWMAGGLPKEDLYENLKRGELVSAERTFEQFDAETALEDDVGDEGDNPLDPKPKPGAKKPAGEEDDKTASTETQ